MYYVYIVLFVCICCVVHRDDNKIAVAIAISFHLISRQVDGGGQALLSPCQACRLLLLPPAVVLAQMEQIYHLLLIRRVLTLLLQGTP